MSKGSTIVISMYNVHDMGLDVTFMAPNLIRVSGEGSDFTYLITSCLRPLDFKTTLPTHPSLTPLVHSTQLVCTQHIHTTSLNQGEWGGGRLCLPHYQCLPPSDFKTTLPTHPSLIPPVNSTYLVCTQHILHHLIRVSKEGADYAPLITKKSFRKNLFFGSWPSFSMNTEFCATNKSLIIKFTLMIWKVYYHHFVMYS